MSTSNNLIGTTIGNFKVTSHLGTGGMGDVFVGWDEKLERQAALKAIKAEHRLDNEARERFLREARVLSKLKHPNICQIFDYIEEAEADYLVLELIEGRSLAAAMKGGIDEKFKMRIAEEICAVLVAAHEQGVVHRDLKPDNVMLTTDGVVKVLDFGLSRSLADEVVAPAAETADPVLSSPTTDPPPAKALTIDLDAEATGVLLAKPESVDAVGPEAIGARSTPEQADPDSTRVLRSTDASPAKSSALDPDSTHLLKSSISPSSAGLTTVGTIMGTLGYMSPEQAKGETASPPSDMYSFGLILQELFTGLPAVERNLEIGSLLENAQRGISVQVEGINQDLKTMINRLKALAPATRPSAVDAAERLAWVRDTPVRQRRRWYKIGGIAALLLFSTAMAIQSWRATQSDKRAQDEARRANNEAEAAKQVSEFLTGIFELSDPGEARGNEVTARELLDKGAEKIDEELRDQPLIRARMMRTMGSVYTALGLYSRSQSLLESSLKIREETLGRDHIDVAKSLNELATLYKAQGKHIEAIQLYRRSLEIRKRVLGPDHPTIAGSLNNLGTLSETQGRNAEAEALYLQSLEIRKKTLGPDHLEVASVLNNLALLYQKQGDYSLAVPLHERSLKIRTENLGEDHPMVAMSQSNLGELLLAEGKLDEAEILVVKGLNTRERVLGPNHPEVAYSLDSLAALRRKQGDTLDANRLYTRAAEILDRAGDSYALPIILANHVELLHEMDRDTEAAKLEARVAEIRAKKAKAKGE